MTGDTPLIIAARNGHERMVDLLLNHGADLTLQNDIGESALDLASPQLRKHILGIHMCIHNFSLPALTVQFLALVDSYTGGSAFCKVHIEVVIHVDRVYFRSEREAFLPLGLITFLA